MDKNQANDSARSDESMSASMRPMSDSGQPVDDAGTTQKEAAQILRELRDRGFNSSSEGLATALGRSAEQIDAYCSGESTIDDDLMMKAQALAQARGID